MDRRKNKPAFFTLALAAGILLSRRFGLSVCGVFAIGGILLFLFFSGRGKWMGALFLFAALGSLLLWLNTPEYSVIPNREVTITGYVASTMKQGKTAELRDVILDDGGERKPIRMSVRLTADQPLFSGQEVEAVGYLRTYEDRKNPGGADFQTIMLAKGVSHQLKAKLVLITGERWNLYTVFNRMKEGIILRMDEAVGLENSGYLQGILFGDKSGLMEETLLDFRQSGLSHLLAVSGLHVGVLVSAICVLLGKTRRKTQLIVIPTVLFAFLFFTGCSPSVLRAAVMAVIYLIAQYKGYRYNLLTALFTAAIVILLCFPYQLYSAGFLLSFSCVLGIGLFSPWFIRRFSRLPSWLSQSLRIYLSCQLGMLPCSVALFYQTQVYGLLANLLAVPLISFALVATLVGVVLMPFGLAHLPLTGAAFVMNGIGQIARLVGRLPYAVVNLPAPPLWLLSLYYGLLFLLVMVWMEKKTWIYGGVTAALGMVLLVNFPSLNRTPTITMLDVGDGLAIHVKTSGGRHVLIDSGKDTGTDTEVIRYLRFIGANDLICINTHEDTDHYAGFMDIAREFRVETFLAPTLRGSDTYRQLILDLDHQGTAVRQILAGDRVVSDGLVIDVLAPKRIGEESSNAHSLNFVADISGIKLLITGDTPIKQEVPYPKIDVLQVAHHGSDTSTSEKMLSQTQPKISLVSGDRYIDNSVLARLGTYYDTQTYGAIVLEIQEGEVNKR